MTSETSSMNQHVEDRTSESTPARVEIASAPSGNSNVAPEAPVLSRDLDPRPEAVLAGITASEFLSLTDAREPVVDEDESASNLDERSAGKPDAVLRNFIEAAPFYGTKESVGMVGTMEATGSAGLLKIGRAHV